MTVETLLTAEGELRDTSVNGDPSKCVPCPACSYLQYVPTRMDVVVTATPGDLPEQDYFEEQHSLGMIYSPKSHPGALQLYTNEVEATCVPIPMRTLAVDAAGVIGIQTGTKDHYKVRRTLGDVVNIFGE